MILLGIFILGRAFYIQRVQGAFWREMGDSLHLKYLPINAERGSIYSEDGNILSTSVPVFDVFVDFGADGLREKGGKRFLEHADSLSMALAAHFGDKSAAEYKKELQLAYKNKERYYLLKRKISFEDYKAFREFPLVRLGRNKSGFIFDIRDKRINPYVLLANRTIGLSRKDSSKNVGLERTYDSLLKGVTGQRLMRYSAGAYMPVEGAELDPINGKDIITTLDTYIQDMAEHELMEMLVGNNSLHGTVIVMETATGKIFTTSSIGSTFPFNGNAVITGSLTITGSNALNITGSATIVGAFQATTKSFKIDHQRLLGKKLIYGVLEGPEHGVYVRGRVTKNNIIQLPEEWEWLIDPDSITVQLTPIGTQQILYVQNIENNTVIINSNTPIDCFYYVQATRKDVAPLTTVE
jgi:hypothetical protein